MVIVSALCFAFYVLYYTFYLRVCYPPYKSELIRYFRKESIMAAKSAKKVMIIGLDAPIVPRLYEYAKAGKLPALGSLIDSGVFGENCMVPFPTITPPNWTTIVTGSWLGTHGITCFNVHTPGDPLDVTHQGFDTADCQSEYLWNAAERAGKKSIIVNYPSSWPSTLKDGWQIAGAGLSLNEWRTQDVAAGFGCTLADEQLFATEEYPQGTQIDLKAAAGWSGAGEKDLEAELNLQYRRAKDSVKDRTWHLLVQDSKGDGYDRILLSESRDADKAFAALEVGEWTKNLVQEFETDKGLRKAVFRCKLMELSKDGQDFRLYVTGICALDGWSHPKELTTEITSEEGLPVPHGGFAAFNLDWIDGRTFMDVLDFQNIWLADAATYLLKNKDWDLYFMHSHCPDWAYHGFSNKVDPLTAESPEQAEEYQKVELGLYQSVDRMLKRILEYADDETLVVVVSDHGAKATTKRPPIAQILVNAGLTVFKQTPGGRPQIDWSKTKAALQRSCYVYVNLKGRDPDGIVEPDAYEEVQDQIVNALYDYTDPDTGKKPIVMALKKQDARIIGLYGDMMGDVVYAISPGYGGQHGPHLPTAKYGVGDLRGLFIMAGPGVKKSYMLERTVWLTDAVPTVCHLADLPIPRDAEGAILYQALDNPDMKMKDMERLRKNYERLKNAYEKEQALTHTYNA